VVGDGVKAAMQTQIGSIEARFGSAVRELKVGSEQPTRCYVEQDERGRAA
jgi:hypothetical protein